MSSRHTEIDRHRVQRVEQFRARYGRDPSEVELRDLSLRSRMPKGQTSYRPVEFWRALGAAHGVTETDIEALRAGSLPSAEDGRARVVAELLGADGLTNEHATFTESALRTAAFQRAAVSSAPVRRSGPSPT